MVDGKIIQGTTPVLNFSLPVPFSDIVDVRFSFSQKKQLVIAKEMSECVVDPEANTITVNLTQEETYLFENYKGLITVRMRVMLQGEQVITSDEILLLAEDSADKVVMKQ